MKRILKKGDVNLGIVCGDEFFTNNLSAKHITCEITENNLLKLNFDCSKSYLIDGGDFENGEEYASDISIFDFYDNYIDKNLQSFLRSKCQEIDLSKVLLSIKFVNTQINEMKFDNSFSRLIKL